MKDYFQDKVVLVTGAASGIGRSLCISLAEAGSQVYVTDVNVKGASLVTDEIQSRGGNARYMQLDVSSREEMQKALEEVCSESGRIDIIINNAGISIGGEVRLMKREHWDKIISVNLMGVLHGTLEAYARMIEQGFGQIVNVSSYLGLVGVPISTAYNTTKFAIVGLSTSLRHEAAPLGIKVNTVCPGYVSTNLIEDGTMLSASAEEMKKLVPVKFQAPEKAAFEIMKGMARNQAIIIFPFHARLFWWINRVNINLLKPVYQRVLKNFWNIKSEN